MKTLALGTSFIAAFLIIFLGGNWSPPITDEIGQIFGSWFGLLIVSWLVSWFPFWVLHKQGIVHERVFLYTVLVVSCFAVIGTIVA